MGIITSRAETIDDNVDIQNVNTDPEVEIIVNNSGDNVDIQNANTGSVVEIVIVNDSGINRPVQVCTKF